MKSPGPKASHQTALGLLAACLAGTTLRAATNTASEKSELSPPHAEIPPSFLQQHGWWLAAGALLLIALAALAIWWRLRPRPSVVVPIEIQARRELRALGDRVQDGRVLSEVSRSLRRYLTAAFELPPEELTTTEFCRAAGASESLGPELAVQVGDFLKRCDELKFAPTETPPAAGAAARALELVEQGETRRARLRAAA